MSQPSEQQKVQLAERFNELKQSYLRTLPEKISALHETWLSAASLGDHVLINELHRLCHSLTGSSAMYGFPTLSKISAHLEQLLDHTIKNKQDPFSESQATRISHIINVLTKSLSSINHTNHSQISARDNQKAALNNQRSAKIMVVDDDKESRQMLSVLLESFNHQIIEAQDGNQAINLYLNDKPDIILMDAIMPGLSGIETTRRLRNLMGDHFTPIIFVTAVNDEDTLVQHIDAGGDDFIRKPINRAMLNAKIQAMLRIHDLYEKLDDYRRKSELEIDSAKHIFNAVINRDNSNIPEITSWTLAAGNFNGDIQLFHKTESGRLQVFLGDFTGHGLSAAIGTVLVAEIFHRMTRVELSGTDIMLEINRKIHEVLPTGIFCAAAFVTVHLNSDFIDVINCGLPSIYTFAQDGTPARALNSQNLPLGILPEENYSTEQQTLPQSAACSILLMTDGVVEASNKRGEMFGQKELPEILKHTDPNELVYTISGNLTRFLGKASPGDDVSIIQINRQPRNKDNN